jgi:amino acid permease
MPLYTGWWAVMTQAAFSFIGTEIVAVRHGTYFVLYVVIVK